MNIRKTVSDKHNNLYAESKKAILVVSCGTSNIDTIEKTIGTIESVIAKEHTDYEVRRAFTSQIAIDNIRKRCSEEIDNVEQALKRLVNDGIKDIVIQPTHIVCGNEYNSLISTAEKFKDKFEAVSMGKPLLAADSDFITLVHALADETADYNADDTALIFVGHGTDRTGNFAYSKLQDTFTLRGKENCFAATLNAEPSLKDVLVSVKTGRYKKVVLLPLMIAAGIHTFRDMAGDEHSWKSAFEAEGFEVHCILKGIGEIKAVQDIYAAHVNDAINKPVTVCQVIF